MEYLCSFFRITVFYYNPNITEQEEYIKRADEQKRLIAAFNRQMESGERKGYPIEVVEGNYDKELFLRRLRDWNIAKRAERGAFFVMKCGF